MHHLAVLGEVDLAEEGGVELHPGPLVVRDGLRATGARSVPTNAD